MCVCVCVCVSVCNTYLSLKYIFVCRKMNIMSFIKLSIYDIPNKENSKLITVRIIIYLFAVILLNH